MLKIALKAAYLFAVLMTNFYLLFHGTITACSIFDSSSLPCSICSTILNSHGRTSPVSPHFDLFHDGLRTVNAHLSPVKHSANELLPIILILGFSTSGASETVFSHVYGGDKREFFVHHSCFERALSTHNVGAL